MLYLMHLRELAPKHRCSVHAYCLMPNHVHILLTPESPNDLSALMRNLGQRFVQYMNRTYDRTGTLWEGRFRSCLVESARYVLACYRYIELNPVRAGLSAQPHEYLWSSYRTNAQTSEDHLITPHSEYLGLGEQEERKRAYAGLFTDILKPKLLSDIRDSTNGGYPLGSKSFKASLKLPPGAKLAPGLPGRPRGAEEDDRSLEIGL